MPQLAEYKDCTSCLACIDACPHQALRGVYNEEGHLVPLLNCDLCVDCGLCEKTCPVVSGLDYSASPLSKVYAAWANDKDIRKTSATAGIFSALAQYVLSKGGYVCGAAIVNGIEVKHICINEADNLHLLQGSKYTQSNTSGIYKIVYQHLREGSLVLFSGTGCQIAGLYGFLGKRKFDGRLITVDLICGGVPSRLLIEKFIENVPYEVKRIVSFRNKENGWSPKGFKYNLKVEDSSGTIHDYTGIRNLITTGFACEMTNRYSCYECNFAGTRRMSDFTIGDYWSIQEYPEQHYNGVSVIISHNESADALLNEAKSFLTINEAVLEDVLAHNKRLATCHDKRYKLPERRLISKLFRRYSYKTLNSIYSFGFRNTSPWILYKIYRIIATKIINWL